MPTITYSVQVHPDDTAMEHEGELETEVGNVTWPMKDPDYLMDIKSKEEPASKSKIKLMLDKGSCQG